MSPVLTASFGSVAVADSLNVTLTTLVSVRPAGLVDDSSNGSELLLVFVKSSVYASVLGSAVRLAVMWEGAAWPFTVSVSCLMQFSVAEPAGAQNGPAPCANATPGNSVQRRNATGSQYDARRAAMGAPF